MKRIFIGSIAVVFLMIAGIQLAQAQFWFLPNPLIGEQVKDFSLSTLDGEEKIFNADFRKDKNTILFFWTTWCPHCRTALTSLSGQMKKLDSVNTQIVLINVGESESVVRAYMKTVSLPVDVWMDSQGVAAEIYEVVGLPTFVSINTRGVIADMGHSMPDVETVFK